MAYIGRDWDNTGTKVTKDDFKRMDNGIKSNDAAITEQAAKIADNTNQINVLSTDRGYLKARSLAVCDLNDIVETGYYCIREGSSNMPYNNWGILEVTHGSVAGNHVVQTYTLKNIQQQRYYRVQSGTTWTEWQQIATTTRRELTGYDIRGGFSYRISHDQSVVKVGNLCTLTACLNTSICQVGTVVLQIPEGYRPIKPVGVACLYGGRGDTCLAEVMTSGEVRLWDFSTPMTTGGFLWINLTYRVV